MKLRFLTPNDTALASPEVGLMQSLRAELLQRPGIAEAADFGAADAVLLHEPWAFREWRYIDRLLADPVVGRAPQKVYTINSDDAGSGLLRGVYCCLAKNRFDPRLHAAVPFFKTPNEQVPVHAGVRQESAPLLATWRGNPKSHRRLRGQLVELYAAAPNFCVESTESWWDHGEDEKTHYIRLLRSGKFSLCPAGWGPASIRIFESMALGVAPVIIADEFVEPAGPDWRKFSLRVREADLALLEPILERYIDHHEEMGALAHEAWREHFAPDRLTGYLADALLDCVRASAGSSASADIGRWRSHRMYRANGWTLPQRLSNRIRRVLHA